MWIHGLHAASAGGGRAHFVQRGGGYSLSPGRVIRSRDPTDLRASREELAWKTLHPRRLRVLAGISPPQTFLL